MIGKLRERFRPLRAAAWLGFLIESNWSDPMVFAVYVLARPLATCLLLAAMYKFVVGGSLADARFAAIYLGNALYAFVLLLLVGLSWAVFEEREMYRTLKYVASSPLGIASYVVGRSLTKFLLACLSAVVVTTFGLVVFHLKLTLTPLSAVALVGALLVGATGVVAVGLVLAGCAMVFARQSIMMNEGVSAVLYLLCGVVFPPEALPAVLRPLAFGLPMTYWMEASRRACGIFGFSAGLTRLSNLELAGLLALTAAVWVAFGSWVFHHMEHRARDQGLLDITTAW